MPTRSKKKAPARKPAKVKNPLARDVETILATLKRLGTKKGRDEMGPRYGIVTNKAFGVAMRDIQEVARPLGKNHELAQELWETGWYEARLLCSFVGDPARVTPAEMDRWCRDFDNWGMCDTICFNLWDRTPHAFAKVEQWAKSEEEFIKRAAFALLACLAGHDKTSSNDKFLRCLPLVERAARDDRNFVKKGVSWALRGVGRRNAQLNVAATELAERLAGSSERAERWVGKEALRDFAKVAQRKPGPVRTKGRKAL